MSNSVAKYIALNRKKKLHNTSSKNARWTFSSKHSRRNGYETKPLVSADTDSNSEEEITLHDIRHLKKSDNSGEASSLRWVGNTSTRNHSSTADPFRNCEFLDLELEEGDTLESISIKYHCPISEIKRANNLISSQDFYALTRLKIPVKKHSLLTEILPKSRNEKSTSLTIKEDNCDVRTIHIGIGALGREKSPEEAAAFFKRMDEDLVKIMLSTKSQKDSLEAAAAALTAPHIQPIVKDPCDGVDCGIQWNYLFICIFVLAFVVPLTIALYMYVRPGHEHNNNTYTITTGAHFSSSFKPSNKR